MPLGFISIHLHSHPCLLISWLFFRVQPKFYLLSDAFPDPSPPVPHWQSWPLPPLQGLCSALSKSCFSGAEGCGAQRMEGTLMLVLCTAIGQNWFAGLRRPHGVAVKGLSFRDNVTEFDSQLCSWLDAWSWGSCLTSPCLCFPICEMSLVVVPPLRG